MDREESNEKKFRRLYRAALDEEVEPALAALGFEAKGRGGYRLHWNMDFDLATRIEESKWNKFGAESFDVVFDIWMIENEDQWVRGIWLPMDQQWKFDSSDAMDGLAVRLLDGILKSAMPLAVDKWGSPSSPEVADVADNTDLEVARSLGGWHIPGEES